MIVIKNNVPSVSTSKDRILHSYWNKYEYWGANGKPNGYDTASFSSVYTADEDCWVSINLEKYASSGSGLLTFNFSIKIDGKNVSENIVEEYTNVQDGINDDSGRGYRNTFFKLKKDSKVSVSLTSNHGNCWGYVVLDMVCFI